MPEKIFNADIYLRLSKEDGDREESDSILHQEAMLREFVEKSPDIRLHKVRKDDGHTGVHFNRPDFMRMIEDIKAGIVDCVIVKDFSRFGRNYIEAGKYIQVLFPQTGIRFIAVNDNYDSAKEERYTSNIIVPFKNMINDAYSADISIKVRSHLEIKRKKGDFIGAFAVYGYTKDPDNNNRLVADDFAADVVRDIFIMKLEGMSAFGIAERLNERGILSPMEYKRFLGMRFSTSFKRKRSCKWQPKAVSRILENEVYIGVMEQGKRVSANYKVRKRENVPKEKWVRVENAHEAIIDRRIFDTVQELLKQDTRSAPKSSVVKPLSGVIFCADCNAAMVHKTNTNKYGSRYGYYVCSAHRADKGVCSTHIISADACESGVLVALKSHTATILHIEQVADTADTLAYSQGNVRRLSERLEAKLEEVRRYNDFRLSLYESQREGVITREDFFSFKASYDVKITEAEAAITILKDEMERAAESEMQSHDWTSVFKNYIGAKALNRKMAVELIERVSVHEKGRLTVKFRYANEFEALKGVA